MTPEQATWIGSLIDRFGLPVVVIGAVAFALYKRWLVTRGEMDDRLKAAAEALADKQAESDGWKALYQQERGDRIEAQQITVKRGEATAQVAEAVASGFETVLKRLPDPYDERLEGTRRRVR